MVITKGKLEGLDDEALRTKKSEEGAKKVKFNAPGSTDELNKSK